MSMTNDLGTDAGSTSMNIVAKTLELLLKLIDKIFEAWRSAPERKAKVYEVKAAKTAEERRKAIKKLDSKTGKVNHDLLVKSGEPRTLCGVNLTKEEIKDFNAICKRQGIVFSVVSNAQLKKDNEKAFLGIECRTADLERIKEAVEIFNFEKRQKAIDERIGEILSKGKENLTEQDYVNLKELNSQKEEMQRTYCDRWNERASDEVIRNVYDESKLKPMNIKEAINRITGRSIDKDQYAIIADAKDPSKIITCHGQNAVDHEGKNYIKTDYEVYHGEELKLKTDDARFEGRPRDYWDTQRNRIEEAADFSGTFYKFFSREEYEKWAESVREQNAELENMDNKDYAEMRKIFEEQLDKNNAELRDGVVYDKESGQPLKDDVQADKINAAESIVIGKQIENCEEIYNLQNELVVAESEVLITPEGTKEHEEALKNKEALQEKLDGLMDKEKELLNERKDINAARAERDTSQERDAERDADQEHDADTDNRGDEHPDERRGDRVDEQEKDKTTMDEVKKDIMNEKAKDNEKAINPAEVLTDKARQKVAKER